MQDGQDSSARVKSAERTLQVLEALAAGPAPCGLAELARRLAVPKSSMHALLRTLVARGWVVSTAGGTAFSLGPQSFHVGMAYVESDDALQRAQDTLDRLSADTGETVQLARLDGADVVYLAVRPGRHAVQLVSAVGRRLPAHATAIGKALLAGLPAAELDARLPRLLPRLTARTITSRRALDAELARTREQGYAVDREETADGLRCFAVALDTVRPAMDAVSIAVPSFRLTPELEQRLVGALGAVGAVG